MAITVGCLDYRSCLLLLHRNLMLKCRWPGFPIKARNFTGTSWLLSYVHRFELKTSFSLDSVIHYFRFLRSWSSSLMLSALIAMLSVLIVEDHQAVREALTEAFLGWGHRVTAAAGLDQAITLTAVNSFDLLVTDVDLNGGDGLELVRTLAPLRPQAAFLVISGRMGRKEVFGS